jgi:hypothetical protein
MMPLTSSHFRFGGMVCGPVHGWLAKRSARGVQRYTTHYTTTKAVGKLSTENSYLRGRLSSPLDRTERRTVAVVR